MAGVRALPADQIARGLVLDWAARGIEASLSYGRIRVSPAAAVLPRELEVLRLHHPAVVVVLLACNPRTLARLARLRARESSPSTLVAGLCRDCGGSLPTAVRWGACGWCCLARRQHEGAPLSESVLEVFSPELVGAYARGGARVTARDVTRERSHVGGLRVARAAGEAGGLFATGGA
jgi:hypothetical protein